MSGQQRGNGQLTMDTLMINTGLTYKQVNQEIVETDFPGIAHLFNCIDDLCDQFELSNADKEDVRRLRNFEGTEAANKEALRKWIKKCRHEATFKNLLIILLKLRREEITRKVAHYVANRPPRPEERKEKQSYYFISTVAVILVVTLAIGIVYWIPCNEDQSIPYTVPPYTVPPYRVPTPNLKITNDQYKENYTFKGLPVLKMIDFKQYKANYTKWWSPPVYTHHHGYKICLGVRASGWRTGERTHISVFVHFMRGEFDDSLNWPFRGNISVRLIDQLRGEDHWDQIIDYNYWTDSKTDDRVTDRDRAELGWGIYKFIKQSELKPNYLLDNTLLFQIHKCSIE